MLSSQRRPRSSTALVIVIFAIVSLGLFHPEVYGQEAASPPLGEEAEGSAAEQSTESTDIGIGWLEGVLAVMIFFYLVQTAFCVRLSQATYPNDATNRSSRSLWHLVMQDMESQYTVIAFIIMAFFIPLAFGAVPDIADLVGNKDNPTSSGIIGDAAVKIVVTALTVLITIELMHLANAPGHALWQRMLVVALSLDIITIIILTVFSAPVKADPSSLTLLMISLVGGSALVSSLLIVVFVRELSAFGVMRRQTELLRQAGDGQRMGRDDDESP